METKTMKDEAETSTAAREQGSFNHEVFLSFRVTDTRNGFTSHLYKALEARGITTFIDSEYLQKGDKISVLFQRIEGSKIFLPVFSQNYADSKWCLREITKIVEINKREGGKRPIIPIFYHVDPSEVRHCRGSFGEAFKKHQHDKELEEEEINEWKSALKAAGELSGYCLSKTAGNEAELITYISERVSDILLGKVRFDIQAVGIIPRIHTLKQMLEREKDGVCIIGICGLGGIGKTTLAKALYNELSPTFEGSCYLYIRSKGKNRDDLPTLQAKLINDVLRGQETKKIATVEQGVSLIKQLLRDKQVLLILDDVDHKSQLAAFTAHRRKKERWFGKGSKVIVTTKDTILLLQHGLQECDIYFPEGLNREDSLQLFCHHAFVSDQPPVGFEELSLEVVEVVQGLPLALEVFGSLFYGVKEKEQWEEKLKKLRGDFQRDGDHKNEVLARLKITYDRLDQNQKNVFLDIACFFIGWKKEYPVYMWEACGYFPNDTLKVLQHKSLIKIDKSDRFQMHDLIRDMGRMIVNQKGNFDPLKYSRPWREDQMLDVLRDAKVSLENPYIQCIHFNEDFNGKIEMNWRVIESMPELRMITGLNGTFHCFEDEENTIRLPSNIRWLEWKNCPYQILTFHNNRQEHLCVLHLTYGKFRDFGSHSMVFRNLKVLNLSWCQCLIRTPNFIHLPSLEVLLLSFCGSLIEMDGSIGRLENLVELSLWGCSKLKVLPVGLCKLSSLESLDLNECPGISVLPTRIGNLRSLKYLGLEGTSNECPGISVLPTRIGNLRSLKYLGLEGTSISDLPDSIGNLQSLQTLNLAECKGISNLPKQIGYLTSLKNLGLGRTSISALPDSIGSLQSLEWLNINGCKGISILPTQMGDLRSLEVLLLKVCGSLTEMNNSIGQLQKLVKLSLWGCNNLKELPAGLWELSSLESLDLSECQRITVLPTEIGNLRSLKYLGLEGASISDLPGSIGNLQSLQTLNLAECKGISTLPKQIGLLTSLKNLDLGRTSISALPNSIGSLQSLEWLNINGCKGISSLPTQMGNLRSLKYLGLSGTSITAVPDSIGRLQSLEKLHIEECRGILSLPKQIGDLRSLKYLGLSGTSLSALPDSIGRLQNLERLDLSNCSSLKKMPDSIGDLKSLSWLFMKNCKFLEQLPNSIGMLTSLKELNIDHCKSLREVPDSLGNFNNDVRISLEGCISLEKLPNSIRIANASLRFDGRKSFRRLPDSTATREQGRFNYEVFISFRGEDTRNGFSSHLYKELKTHGITAFIDSEDLIKGDKITVLFKHIEQSKIFLPVFSKNYTNSKWCLMEITKMVEIYKTEPKRTPIIPIFYHVAPSDVRHCNDSFGGALENRPQYKQFEKEDINKWKSALTEAGDLSGYCLSETEGNEVEIITRIRKRVSDILCKVRFDIQPVGIIPRIHTLKQMLEKEKDGICMIGICGMGGIGKTTLAMALYNELSPTFEGSCFLSDIRSKSEDRDGLPTLQKELMNQALRRETEKIVKVEHGVSLIKQSLGVKKVLVILDDVDDKEQLEAFTADRRAKDKWFGEGSKIIVTTRDKRVLLQHGLQERDIYFLEGLNREDSLQLFCHHAFVSDPPPVGFEELSLEVVKVAEGLPLALKVFGPLFCDVKEKKEFEERLETLKRDQHKKLHERLKISYDSLDQDQQSVFLDIACFFIGKKKECPVYMWKACGYSPTIILTVLQNKSLIKVGKFGHFEMHDQIRDMGRMIVKEEGNLDPLKYSRLWSWDQMSKVLRDVKVSQGSSYVEGIHFNEVFNGKIEMSWRVMEKMPKLRMITCAHSQYHCFEDEEESIHLPSNIRWLEWRNCPYQTLTFHNNKHEKLCVLHLPYGEFRDSGLHSMVFPNLKVLNLSWCQFLIRTPDFTHLPSLEVLMLKVCGSLTEMDNSIGQLQKLVKLSFWGCSKLKGLSSGLYNLSSLESLDLSECQGISVLQTEIGNLRSLKYLGLEGTSISDLPNSIGNLQSLQTFNLAECKGISILPIQIGDLTSLKDLGLERTSISALPDSIGSLQSLERLNINGCKGISSLPTRMGNLRSLKYLGLSGTSITAVPDSIGRLQSLEKLHIEECIGILSLPKQIGDLRSLKYLGLSGTSLSALPDSVRRLQNLERLDLSNCSSLKKMPDSIGDLKSLSWLFLKNCKFLEQLPNSRGMLTSLKELNIDNCKSLREVPDSLGDLNNDIWISLEGCISLEKLPKSIRIPNASLYFDGCKSLRRLPDPLAMD